MYEIDVLQTMDSWTHVVSNFLGTDTGEGIRLFQDGVKTGSDDAAVRETLRPGDGRVAVGRHLCRL